jgi:hypothetical protein
MQVEAEDWMFLYCGKMPPTFDDLVPAASSRAGNLGSSPGTTIGPPVYLSREEIEIISHLRAALDREKLVREFGLRRCQGLKEELVWLKGSCTFLRYGSRISAIEKYLSDYLIIEKELKAFLKKTICSGSGSGKLNVTNGHHYARTLARQQPHPVSSPSSGSDGLL